VKSSVSFARLRLPLGLAAVSIAYVALVIAFCPIRFTDNDCVLLRDYAMNGLHVQFLGLLFTDLLHVLYVHVPSVPWFGAALYACHVLCIYVWLSLISKAFKASWLAWLYAALFLVYYLLFLISLDYTSTGVMLCTTGLMLAFTSMMDGKKDYRLYLLFGLLFVLGTWVRPQVALGTLAFMFPVGLYAAWCTYAASPRIDEIKRIAVIGMLFLAPSALNTGYEYFYRAELQPVAEKQFYAFNAARGYLTKLNMPRKRALIHNHKVLKSIHWKVAYIRSFYGWDFLDERIYNTDTLGTLVAHADPRPLASGPLLHETFVRPFLKIESYFLLLLSSIALFLLVPRRPLALRIIGAAIPFYCMLVFALMKAEFLFPVRVASPFATALGFAALLIAARDFQRAEVASPVRRYVPLLISAGLCIAGAALYLAAAPHMDFRKRRSDLPVVQKIDVLNGSYQDDIVLVQPHHGLQLERLNPLREPDIRFRQLRLGWNTFSPGFYQQVSGLGVSHGYEIMDAMVDNPHALMLGRPDWCRAQLAHTTQSAGISVVPMQHFLDGTALCSLQRRPEPQRTGKQ